MLRSISASLLLLLLIPSPSMGKENPWLPVTERISKVLDDVSSAYEKGKIRDAKSYLTDAYFGIFEATGMEGAIRTGISARRAYEVESMFGDIRKAINRKAPASEVKDLVEDLKRALREDAERLYRFGILPGEG